MKRRTSVLTLEDIKNSAAGKRNAHLFEDNGLKKRKVTDPKKSKALKWLELNLQMWSNEKLLTMEREYRFDELRKWRFDFAWPALKIAVEYEGGIFMQKSGHNTARHYTKDTDKYNHAAVKGWRVARVTALNYESVLGVLEGMVG